MPHPPLRESDLSAPPSTGPSTDDHPTDRARSFLDAATSTPAGLAQSYTDQAGLGRTAFLYDNAVAILAYLADVRPDSALRARAIGDALLTVQRDDPTYADGRFREAYLVEGGPHPGFGGSAVGELTWTGIALLALGRRTREGGCGYVDAAVRIGDWIHANTCSDGPLGGYRGGVDAANTPLPYTSTEHNIGCVALFGQLARVTGDRGWRHRRDHAASFLTWMWSAADGRYHTGSDDGATINVRPVPADAQCLSYLALDSSRYQSSVDWCRTELASSSGEGIGFSTAGTDGVWYEGNGQLATALRQRRRPGDEATADRLLRSCERAQDTLGVGQTIGGRPLPERAGIVAANTAVDTGYGFGYYPYRHVGATAWYLLASSRVNPLAA